MNFWPQQDINKGANSSCDIMKLPSSFWLLSDFRVDALGDVGKGGFELWQLLVESCSQHFLRCFRLFVGKPLD
jgi:hypothetical protein